MRALLGDGGRQHRPTRPVPERMKVDGAQLLRLRAPISREPTIDEDGGQIKAPPLLAHQPLGSNKFRLHRKSLAASSTISLLRMSTPRSSTSHGQLFSS
eukprot:jgi/Tetstr1/450234/TSEL_037272.t1